MSKVKDLLVVMLAFVMLVVGGYQGISHADDPANGLPRFVENYCKADLNHMQRVRGYMVNNNPLVAGGRVIGDSKVYCPRNATNARHNKVYTVAFIEKRRRKNPEQWFRYRQYAKVYDWNGGSLDVYPLASVQCDGHALYRYVVKFWTAEGGVNPKSYPSRIVTKKTDGRSLCANTVTQPLTDVNS